MKLAVTLTLLLLAVSSTVLAQAPTGFVLVENVQTVSPYNLGTNMSWNAVTGATSYDTYRAPGTCTGSPSWVLLATVTTTTYTDPNIASINNPAGLGEYCYAVDSVVGGVKSPMSAGVKIAIGDKSYWTIQYYTDITCKTLVSPYPSGGSYELHQVDLNGVDTIILQKTFGPNDNVVGWVQLIDAFRYYSVYVDASGKRWTIPFDTGSAIPAPNTGPSISSIPSNQGTLRLRPALSGMLEYGVCNSYNQPTNEPATTNP